MSFVIGVSPVGKIGSCNCGMAQFPLWRGCAQAPGLVRIWVGSFSLTARNR
jgi:hypothetical protein